VLGSGIARSSLAMVGVSATPGGGPAPRRIVLASPCAKELLAAIETNSICDFFGFPPGHFAEQQANALAKARAFEERRREERRRAGGDVHGAAVAVPELQVPTHDEGTGLELLEAMPPTTSAAHQESESQASRDEVLPGVAEMSSTAKPASESTVSGHARDHDVSYASASTAASSSTAPVPQRTRRRSLMAAGSGFAAVAARLKSNLATVAVGASGVLPRRRRGTSQRVHPTASLDGRASGGEGLPFEPLVPVPPKTPRSDSAHHSRRQRQ